jgi:hypothetical protein
MTTADLTRTEIEAILATAEARTQSGADRRRTARIPAINEADYCPDCGWYLPNGDHGAC